MGSLAYGISSNRSLSYISHKFREHNTKIADLLVRLFPGHFVEFRLD